MTFSSPFDTASFESVEAPDLVELVEAQLTRAIVEGRLAPGSRIVEADIARRMGVSRAPVREAARRLERQGVLVARPRHGFAVRTISVQEIDDIFEVRISLEMTAIERACSKADDAGLARLQELVHAMVRDAPTQPQHQRIATDLAFHTLICELSGNEDAAPSSNVSVTWSRLGAPPASLIKTTLVCPPGPTNSTSISSG